MDATVSAARAVLAARAWTLPIEGRTGPFPSTWWASPLAALGLLNPTLAGAAMACSSLGVACNALPPRRWRPRQG